MGAEDHGGSSPNRRRALRVPARLEVAYEDADRQVFLMTADVSESGAFLVSPDPPELGVSARLVFELPGHAAIVRVPAVVARRSEAPLRGFAVRFQTAKLPPSTRSALQGYVQRVSDSAFDSIG